MKPHPQHHAQPQDSTARHQIRGSGRWDVVQISAEVRGCGCGPCHSTNLGFVWPGSTCRAFKCTHARTYSDPHAVASRARLHTLLRPFTSARRICVCTQSGPLAAVPWAYARARSLRFALSGCLALPSAAFFHGGQPCLCSHPAVSSHSSTIPSDSPLTQTLLHFSVSRRHRQPTTTRARKSKELKDEWRPNVSLWVCGE
jgi:hypothetical protein